MAMATNASAGAIVYDSLSVSASVSSLGAATSVKNATNVGVVVPNRIFGLGVKQVSGGPPQGLVFISNPAAFSFLTAAGFVQKLASNAAVSSLGAFKRSTQLAIAHQPGGGGWSAGQTGFAGFRFTTSGMSHQTDYGWVRLDYTEGTNGLANSITAVDWAYDTSGAPITAGDVGAPEPSTTALAILAAGAAGVAALRRRRNASA